jgi:hypothetical protein
MGSLSLQAPLLNPFSPAGVPRSILVCDNCAIHHDEEIQQLVVDECGMIILSETQLLLIFLCVYMYFRSKALLSAPIFS